MQKKKRKESATGERGGERESANNK